MGMTLKSSLMSNLTMIRPILMSTLSLSEVLVIGRALKLGTVEGRMKMDAGGMQRQALRLGILIYMYIHVYIHNCAKYIRLLYLQALRLGTCIYVRYIIIIYSSTG